MKPRNPKPLYRKVNTRARRVRHRFGGDFRHARHAKRSKPINMPKGVRRGLDYTPLFLFLLSKVGQTWDAVFSEAVMRLDRPQPIFWLVSLQRDSAQAAVRVGESSYFSGLYVDEGGVLRKFAPELNENSLEPSCGCCIHTFNGKSFTKRYQRDRAVGV